MILPARGVRSALPAAWLAAPLALLLIVLAGCAQGQAATFDPGSPCVADVQQSGAYPDLEAEVPVAFEGEPPVRLDSGRNCSDSNLGTLARHGIQELRFAGGVWETGDRSGISIAVFSAPGLTLERMAEFYEAGARTARKTEATETSEYDVGGVQGWRLDTLNDESFQTIVVLEAAHPDQVRAVLVASDVREVRTREAHEKRVVVATETAVGSP